MRLFGGGAILSIRCRSTLYHITPLLVQKNKEVGRLTIWPYKVNLDPPHLELKEGHIVTIQPCCLFDSWPCGGVTYCRHRLNEFLFIFSQRTLDLQFGHGLEGLPGWEFIMEVQFAFEWAIDCWLPSDGQVQTCRVGLHSPDIQAYNIVYRVIVFWRPKSKMYDTTRPNLKQRRTWGWGLRRAKQYTIRYTHKLSPFILPRVAICIFVFY